MSLWKERERSKLVFYAQSIRRERGGGERVRQRQRDRLRQRERDRESKLWSHYSPGLLRDGAP